MAPELELVYEGRGFSGTFDLAPWIERADADDVVALMAMRAGVSFDEAPFGIVEAYRELAGADAGTDPAILLFRDQHALLQLLRGRHPLLWEAASGSTLRCEDTPDMFGDAP